MNDNVIFLAIFEYNEIKHTYERDEEWKWMNVS